MLQLMHAERVRDGGNYRWSNYFEPDKKLINAFNEAGRKPAAGWDKLEPEFT